MKSTVRGGAMVEGREGAGFVGGAGVVRRRETHAHKDRRGSGRAAQGPVRVRVV